MKTSTTLRALALAGAATTAVALAAPGNAAPTGPRFAAPVKVTPTLAGGYEPGIYADSFGNLYATAHKENAELAISPDSRSTTQTRSMSWTWYSDDHGKSWKNLPGPAGLDVQNHNFGDEGDMAIDDAGNVYFVDTNVTDISFTSWHADGLGKIAFKSHLPTVGFGEPVDDRPWVTAHNDGHVFYFGNEGNKNEYPLGQSGEAFGSGSGPGRYTVYSSYDGGTTWDHLGISLKDSGWCRPAAAPHSPYVYAMCTNDNGKIYSFVSANDGKQWKRYDVPGGYTAKGGGGFESYPNLQVMKDGSLWGFYLDPDSDNFKGGVPLRSHMYAYHSVDHGKTWKRYDVTPKNGAKQFEYGWMSVSPDGKKLGYAVYGRPTTKDLWRVYATTFTLGQKPVLTSLDEANPVTTDSAFPEAPGDFLMATFDNRGQFHVTWTRAVNQINAPDGGATGEGQRSLFRDIYSASTT